MSSVQRGRPRSEAARLAILTATRDLVIERGFDGLTVTAIAERAGTGVQTLYRWWPDKAAIVADCVLENVVDIDLITAPDTGDAAADLRVWIRDSYDRLAAPPASALFRALAVVAAKDSRVSARLDEQLGAPLRSALTTLLTRGIAAGRVRSTVDVDATADVLLGAMMIAIVAMQQPSASRAEAIADVILGGLLAD